MDKITINGKRYISLGDFYWLRHNMILDIYDQYEKDENGEYHLSAEDETRIRAYVQIMYEILSPELDRYAGEEAQKTYYQKALRELRREWLNGNYIIEGKDDGKAIYYRKMCPYAPKPEDSASETEHDYDEGTPVFTSIRRLAEGWSDHYRASCFCDYLKSRTGMDSLKVVPAWMAFSDGAAEKRLLKAIFGDDYQQDGSGAGQTFSPDADDTSKRWCVFLESKNDEPAMWFSQWMEYIPGMELPPSGPLQELFDKLRMKPGDRKPVFIDAYAGDVRLYDSKEDAATAIAELAECEPDLADRLHVMQYEVVPDGDDQA